MNTNEMIRGVVYEPYNSEIMQAVQIVSGQVNGVSGQIQSGMQEVIRKVDLATRKPKKRKSFEQLTCLKDGSLVIMEFFDDGSNEVQPFIVNSRGTWNVVRICVEDEAFGEFFAIMLEISTIGVIGRYDKLCASYLYNIFVRMGICFDAHVTKNRIGNLLFETFAPKLENPDTTLTISSRAGWSGGRMVTKNNFPFANVRDFKGLPVMKKTLAVVKMDVDMWKAYFYELQCILGRRERFFIMVFPFVGILSSLMGENGIYNRICANIVPVGKFSTRRCCSWMQIFNRGNFYVTDSNITERNFNQKMEEIKDEILLLDCRAKAGENQYSMAKKKKIQERAKAIFIGDMDMQKGTVQSVLVMLSDDLVQDDLVQNILLSDENLKSNVISEEVVEEAMTGVITEFVCFVERHMTEVQHILKKPWNTQRWQTEAIEKVFEIVQEFGKDENIDFLASAGLGKDFDVTYAMEEILSEPVDILPLFVKAVRREAGKFRFVRKDVAEVSDTSLIYDEEYFWISSAQLKNILNKNGLGKYLTEILYEAKAEKKLKTDSDGSLTRRLQCAGVRTERYQFCRELFDRVGDASIVDLGGEE